MRHALLVLAFLSLATVARADGEDKTEERTEIDPQTIVRDAKDKKELEPIPTRRGTKLKNGMVLHYIPAKEKGGRPYTLQIADGKNGKDYSESELRELTDSFATRAELEEAIADLKSDKDHKSEPDKAVKPQPDKKEGSDEPDKHADKDREKKKAKPDKSKEKEKEPEGDEDQTPPADDEVVQNEQPKSPWSLGLGGQLAGTLKYSVAVLAFARLQYRIDGEFLAYGDLGLGGGMFSLVRDSRFTYTVGAGLQFTNWIRLGLEWREATPLKQAPNGESYYTQRELGVVAALQYTIGPVRLGAGIGFYRVWWSDPSTFTDTVVFLSADYQIPLFNKAVKPANQTSHHRE